MGDRQVTPFFRFGPRIDISTSGNLGRFLQKFYGLAQQKSVFIGISGVWGAKKRPTKASIAPTALRSGGNCLFSSSGICNDFLLVAITPLCLRRPRQCEPHPRSWRTIRHEKPRALKPWARCSKVLLSNNKLIRCCQTINLYNSQEFTTNFMNAVHDALPLLWARLFHTICIV